jgi:hypothetical protein
MVPMMGMGMGMGWRKVLSWGQALQTRGRKKTTQIDQRRSKRWGHNSNVKRLYQRRGAVWWFVREGRRKAKERMWKVPEVWVVV